MQYATVWGFIISQRKIWLFWEMCVYMNKSIKHTVFVGVIVLLLYLVASLFHSTLWSDIFASICSSLAAVIILYSMFKSDAPHFNPNFILIGLSVLLWAVADILWAFYAIVLHQDPSGIEIISLLYCGTNIFLVLSTILFGSITNFVG